MQVTTEQIQLEVLARLSAKQGCDVMRKDVAAALKVDGKAVDAAMARCALVRRVTANGGSFNPCSFGLGCAAAG